MIFALHWPVAVFAAALFAALLPEPTNPQTSLAALLAIRRADGGVTLPPKGRLVIYPLSAEYIAVAGDYDRFMRERVTAAWGKRLKLADQLLARGVYREFSNRFFYNFASAELLGQYHPIIRDNFERREYFKFSVNGQPLEIKEQGSWLNALGMFRMPELGGSGEKAVRAANIAHFAYFRLAKPLAPGDRIELLTANGEVAGEIYDPDRTVSRAIKINQAGYSAEAGKKFAYFGQWLGSLGLMEVEPLAGKEFQLCDSATGKVVYTGRTAWRSKLDQYVRRDKYRIPLWGEQLLEMDFSDFKTPGRYYLRLPGAGRSWDFPVGPDAIGRMFYVQMRGLYHQRSGIAKTLEYTKWPLRASHMEVFRGDFPPEEREYTSRFTAPDGSKVDRRWFYVVKKTATDEKLPASYGGWWDAADYDRRNRHFAVVNDLLAVYLLWPENFSDGQLDIPESGNGIPDIIDEAAWGVDVWRRLQSPDGGIGCWIEAVSHPGVMEPALDPLRYYLAMPTRKSSLEYCVSAAMLARAYRKCGADKQGELFFESARRAWKYAHEAKAQVRKFASDKYGTITYTEPDGLPAQLEFKAALNLFLYSGDPEYDNVLTMKMLKAALEYSRLDMQPFLLAELAEEQPRMFEFSSQFRKMVRGEAAKLLASQSELNYRTLNFKLDSMYFTYLGFGRGIPVNRGAFLLLAWYIDKDDRCRDGAFLADDWMGGANPMGRTFTTGLGYVYPVRPLSHPCIYLSSRADDPIADPIPGLTPYTYSGRVHESAFSYVYSLDYGARIDHLFAGLHVPLLPHKIYPDSKLNMTKLKESLYETIPLWRRHIELEGMAVGQNEFTVWETMGPAAAFYGALLTPGWKPPAEWKKIEPKKKIEDIPGYLFLP
ncbi:MAG: glycoside hydrolase family 9 protein [Victivallaceae bacterium]|nr:glycoside hydrolase family 9 protein [Victivallaceae bacterium]